MKIKDQKKNSLFTVKENEEQDAISEDNSHAVFGIYQKRLTQRSGFSSENLPNIQRFSFYFNHQAIFNGLTSELKAAITAKKTKHLSPFEIQRLKNGYKLRKPIKKPLKQTLEIESIIFFKF